MEVARWAIDCVQDTQSLCPNSTAKSLLQAALWLPPPALPSALAEVVMEVAWAAQGRDEVMENIIIAEGVVRVIPPRTASVEVPADSDRPLV
eukprot:s696_g2.t1